MDNFKIFSRDESVTKPPEEYEISICHIHVSPKDGFDLYQISEALRCVIRCLNPYTKKVVYDEKRTRIIYVSKLMRLEWLDRICDNYGDVLNIEIRGGC